MNTHYSIAITMLTNGQVEVQCTNTILCTLLLYIYLLYILYILYIIIYIIIYILRCLRLDMEH